MVGQHSIQKIAFVSLLFLAACQGDALKSAKGIGAAVPPHTYLSGDILCRYGEGFFSQYFRRLASRDKLYSHVGVVAVSNDSIFVYHAEASELTGIGGVKKEPLKSFLLNVKTYGLYRLQATDSIRNKITARAKRYQENNTPFDLDFDLRHDNRLYCTELVANCINYATQENTIQAGTKLQRRLFYGIDDIYKNKNLISVMEKQSK